MPAIKPIASNTGLGIKAKANNNQFPCFLKCFPKILNHFFFSSLCLVSLCPAKPNAKPMLSPAVAPKAETKATKTGGYKFPPATTVRNVGADTKKDALDAKLIINNPINPKDVDCLKKSLKIKKAIDKTIDKININTEATFPELISFLTPYLLLVF